MAKVLLKKSSVGDNAPDTGDLAYGEVAINYADGRLYYKNSSNEIKNFIDSDLLDATYIRSVLDDPSPELSNNLEIHEHRITNDAYGPGSYIGLQEYYTGDSDLFQQMVIASRQDVNVVINTNGGTLDGNFYIRYGDSDVNNSPVVFKVGESGIISAYANIDMVNNGRIGGLAYPTVDSDATNKIYVDTQDNLKLNLSGGNMSGALDMGGNRITTLSDPALAQDAATKKYVDDTVATGVGAMEYPSGDYGSVDSAGAIDAFGVFISIEAYDHMDPVGSVITIEHGTDSSI